MEKEFIPYDLALKLKELGFDEECMGLYEEIDNNIKLLYADPVVTLYLLNTAKHEGRIYHCKSPLWQQAFDWFREIGYDTSILRTPPEMVGIGRIKKYSYFIWKEDDNPRGNQDFEDTYEEAREKCLKKLIELL